MTVTTRRIPNEQIIVVTISNPFTAGDPTTGNRETARLLDENKGPVYRIEDLSSLDLPFSVLVQGMAEATHRSSEGSLNDPRAPRLIMVGSKPNHQMIVDSLKQAQYGGLNVPLFATVEEALAHARAELKKA